MLFDGEYGSESRAYKDVGNRIDKDLPAVEPTEDGLVIADDAPAEPEEDADAADDEEAASEEVAEEAVGDEQPAGADQSDKDLPEKAVRIREAMRGAGWMETSEIVKAADLGYAVRARSWFREFREIALMCAVCNIKQAVTQ